MERKEAVIALGLVEPFDEKALKKAYKSKSKEYHPDTPTGNKVKFQLIAEAYNLLTKEVKDVSCSEYTHYTIMDIIQVKQYPFT